MGRLRSRVLFLLLAIISLWNLAGCGGGAKAGTPLFAGKVNLSPSGNTSVVQGGTFNFIASAQTASGTNLAVPITYSSSDTSILNLASNGVACAGHWDAAFTTCIPGNVGVVKVTASALGESSVPTYVFVHPPIDSITVGGVLLNNAPPPGPCLSQGQTMTVEAHAFSQGVDITSSVGPFIWSSTNTTVVALTPLVNSAYTFATNQATAKANVPGITRIVASASGVSSAYFQQPQYQNAQNQTAPVLDFFATCPISKIQLELGAVGSGQSTFSAPKSSTQTAFATVTDVLGNSSLPNTHGGVVLSKTPLTWASSHPGAVSTAASCALSCSISLPSPGAGTVTASCSPPGCNIGFPQIPASLSTAAQIDTCTNFFAGVAPAGFSCQQLIPAPVYSSPLVDSVTELPLPPATGAISGVVTGAPVSASVFAASTGCSSAPPAGCFSAGYYFSTTKAVAGNENPFPVNPNSFLLDLSGTHLWMGSDFGSVLVNPANFGSANSPYTSLGTVTGKVISVSNSGTSAVFSDTIHTPNQAYVINGASTSSVAATALTIPAAKTAGFSLDGLKTLIVGGTNATSLYVYSQVQALQGPIALTGPGDAVAFSPNGAFGFVAESANGASSANVTAFSTCNNQVAASLALPADPVLMKVLPNSHMDGIDSAGHPILDGIHILVLDSTGFDILTARVSPTATGTLCPQGLTFTDYNNQPAVQRVELGQGTIAAGTYTNFFTSGDATQIYFVNGSASTILTYDFIVGTVTGGIELSGSATPLSAAITADSGTIVVAGSDGLLHEVSTSLGGADLVQVSFPNLPNYLNPFCSSYPGGVGSCVLNVAITKP